MNWEVTSLNKIYKAFDEIHASEDLKTKTLNRCKPKVRMKYIPQLVAACLVLFTFVGGTGIFHASTTEAAYISLDVNPSIGLSLNQFKRVISVDTYNDDAVEVVEGLDLKGKKYSDAVDDIFEAENLLGYDVSAAEIYIEGNSENLNQEINDTIKLQCPNANLTCHNVNNKEKAMEYNISPGKYYLIEQIVQYGGTIDEYVDKSMNELKEIYSQYTGESYSGNHHNEEHGNGAGNGTGLGMGNGAGNGTGVGNGSGNGAGSGMGSGNGTGQGSGHGKKH